MDMYAHKKNQEDRKKYLAAKQLEVISKKFMKVESLQAVKSKDIIL